MPQSGGVIGGYVLDRPLGEGGNAEVWRAAKPDQQPIALKVLKKTDAEHDRYRRFRREVTQHKRLTEEGFSGILPLFDYELPDQPSKKQPAWLAMPIAVPLIVALGPSPALEDVVAALADVADTLSRLHEAEPPVAHRDIKPSNCYRYEDMWVISDFGLVETLDADPLTLGTMALGPRNFIAPEMIAMPDRAQGPPADVYSLGKTLWSLVTGNRTPPPGEHRPAEWPWKNLAEFGVAHPRAFYLDRLIGQMTQEVPERRLKMASVARDLRGWSSAPRAASIADLDVGDIAEALKDVFARGQRPGEIRKLMFETANRIAGTMASQAEPITRILNDVSLQNTGFVDDFSFSVDILQTVASKLEATDRVAAYRTCSIGSPVATERNATLSSGVGVALSTDNQVALAAAHTLRTPEGRVELWADSALVTLDSEQQEREIARLVEGLIAGFKAALLKLLESVN